MNADITIDARWLVGGIGTYTRRLLRGLKESGNGFRIRAITRGEHKAEVEPFCDQVSVLNVPIYSAGEQWRIPRIAAGHDLLHVPHYNAPVFPGIPLVITLHDIIHLSNPDYRRSYKSLFYAQPLLRWVTRRASHIITVSQYSKSQIIQRLGIPGSKVTAIHNGVGEEFTPKDRSLAAKTVAEAMGIACPYILYVGSLKRYKNVSALLKAFAQRCATGKSIHRLLIVGDESQSKAALIREAATLGIASRTTFMSNVSSNLLPLVYSAADLFVFPSTMEGFGLPLVEAMSCGVPVLSSNATCLPEVGGDAALYFDPYDPQHLASLLCTMLNSGEMRRRFREKGLERVRLFTWKQSLQRHVEVYQQVLRQCQS